MKVPLSDIEDQESAASPPPYTESDTNTAYNPSYLQSPPAHSSTSSAQQLPSAPPTGSLYPDPSRISPRQQQQPSIPHDGQQQGGQQQWIPSSFQTNPSAYQTIAIPPRAPHVVYRRQDFHPRERRFPMACLFFLLGWFCPLLWLFGACCCSGSRNRYEAWWGRVNLVMAVLFFITTVLVSVFSPQMTDWVVLQASFISSILLGASDKDT